MLRDLLILGLAIAVRTFPAQGPAAETSEQPFKLSVTAELVLLDVGVESPAGEHVSGLKKSSFTIYEDGKAQTISHFANEDVPVTAGLVIDASRSMRNKRPEVVTAALAFIRASNKNDEIFVVHFSDSVSLGLPVNLPFTSDLNALRSALWKGGPPGRTALNDAVLFALNHLEQGRRDRRTLVLVSDGGDNNSVHRAADVMRTVLESRTTIYAIGISDTAEAERNPELLRHLARISGGQCFLDVELSAVDSICKQIARDIRERYTIGYVPVRSGSHRPLRKIKVTASTPNGHQLIVHSRTSYVLPLKPPMVD